jgi:hypothetical protein
MGGSMYALQIGKYLLSHQSAIFHRIVWKIDYLEKATVLKAVKYLSPSDTTV